MNTDALDDWLALNTALARWNRQLDEALGNWHGLSFADLRLLDQLACGDDQAQRLGALAEALGQSSSATLRQVLPLEKTGLVERRPAANDPGSLVVALRAPGLQSLKVARETAGAICARAQAAGAVARASLRPRAAR
ncbi:MAG: MarR family transcriptional regulator [Rubrivivax sp.]|jgi:DNA-binding MarR family transcriptional regulator|nr:MarR family transcriptional regulator [Rubrivivax sp.]MBK8526969.1 MarR family transcriptional regulator [Rubrivivax sp.]